jgi:transposase-like protein
MVENPGRSLLWLATWLKGILTESIQRRLELRVPQDRQGRFSTELFERYQRSEKALVGALAEMYVQGATKRRT